MGICQRDNNPTLEQTKIKGEINAAGGLLQLNLLIEKEKVKLFKKKQFEKFLKSFTRQNEQDMS